MHACEGEHKPPDDPDACYCCQPVLERLGSLKKGVCHPVEGHRPWYQLDPDDKFVGRIQPFVTHRCSEHCFNEDGTLKPDLDGLSGAKGQPKHVNGATSLPPLDPRPELKRTVMNTLRRVLAPELVPSSI